jgi:hypothetical protein
MDERAVLNLTGVMEILEEVVKSGGKKAGEDQKSSGLSLIRT